MPRPWLELVANWATDNGVSMTSAVIALSGTRAWMEARKAHEAGATEKVVRYNLSLALAQAGMAPARVD